MNKCSYCNVLVDDTLSQCPLCFKSLAPITEAGASQGNSMFPAYDYELHQKNSLTIKFKLALFGSLAGAGICTLINALAWPGYFWAIYVIVSIIYAWLLIRITVMSKRHAGVKVLLQLVVVSAMLFIIDYLFGHHRWSINIVIPFMIMSAITLILIMVIKKRMLWSDYIGCALVIITSGFAPLIFYAIGISTLLWPAIATSTYAALVYLGMWVFRDKQLKSEFIRRFHF